MENMSEGFLLLSTDKIILTINHSAIRLLYAKDTDYIGKNILYLSRNEVLYSSIDCAIKGESTSTDIFINGRYIQILSNPVYEKNKIIGVMCILLDVTAKRKRKN